MRTLLVLLLLWNVQSATQAQFEGLEAKVRQALAADRPYRALTLTERALTRNGAPEVFHVLRAEAYNRIGEYTKAMEQLRRTTGPQRLTGEFGINAMGAYTGLGHLDSAAALIQSVPASVRSEEYFYRAGRVYELQQDWTAALGIFQSGIAQVGSTPRLLREQGACHAMLGDSVRARADFDQAIAGAPRQAAAYNSRAYYCYMHFGRYAQALPDLDRAIKQDPNYGFAFSNRGWCHFKLGNVQRAQKDLALAIRKDPTNAYAHRSAGIIALEQREGVKACGYLRKAVELGFTRTYGTEVEELLKLNCSDQWPVSPAPAAPPPSAPTTNPNAPPGTSPRNNAP